MIPPAALEAILDQVNRQTGLSFQTGDRRQQAEHGVEQAMRHAHEADPWRYVESLKANTLTLDDLVVQLTVGETYFFREPAQFERIRNELIPELLRQKGRDHVFRVWSLGCASGEEPYSIAILFHQMGLTGQCEIVATDISTFALSKARRAEYGPWSLRGVGAALARPYLRTVGDRLILNETIRDMVQFRQETGAEGVVRKSDLQIGWDLILCRNMMIYLDKDSVAKLSKQLYDRLAPDGWLFTASSDPPLAGYAPFVMSVGSNGFCYRKPTRSIEQPSIPLPKFHGVASEPKAPATTLTATARTVLNERTTPAVVKKPAAPSVEERRRAALKALEKGDSARAAELSRDDSGDETLAAIYVRAAANLDPVGAGAICDEMLKKHRLSVELHYLRAILQFATARDDEAVETARRVVYLNRDLAIGHFLLGTACRKRGDASSARRSFRNVVDLCNAKPSESSVPLSDGATYSDLMQAALVQLAGLDNEESVA